MRFLTVAPPGALTELVLEVDDGTDKPKGGITFVADDVDATYAELSARGSNSVHQWKQCPGERRPPGFSIPTATPSSLPKGDRPSR